MSIEIIRDEHGKTVAAIVEAREAPRETALLRALRRSLAGAKSADLKARLERAIAEIEKAARHA